MKTEEVLDLVAELGIITEQQINLLKNRKNRGEKIDFNSIWNMPPNLTKEQNLKGIKFLKNIWKTPKGKERINNPFGYREERALETFEYFKLSGFYDVSKYERRTCIVPLYEVIGAEESFQYYYDGKVNIVG